MGQSLILALLMPIYGIVIMGILLDVKFKNISDKQKMQFLIFSICVIFINIIVYISFDKQVYRNLYFILIQLPIYLGFRIISEYKGIKLIFTLLTTITCASVPVSLVIDMRVLTNGKNIFMIFGFIVACILMIPLIYFFYRPNYVYMLKFGKNKSFCKFAIIPLLYYLYGYLGSGYNFMQYYDLDKAFVRKIPDIIVLVSYVLLLDIFKYTREQQLSENSKKLFNIQLDTATKQIEQLRIADKQSAIYRHDIKHHLNFLNTCILENRLEDAKEYIRQTHTDIDSIAVKKYSSFEPLNLILSSYIEKATKQDIMVEAKITANDFSNFKINDLCVLISNAIDDAINASSKISNKNDRYIKLRLYEKNNRLCFEICNSYLDEPIFENKIPVSKNKNHGIGTKSIIYILEKYNGIYSFKADKGNFTFQMSIK